MIKQTFLVIQHDNSAYFCYMLFTFSQSKFNKRRQYLKHDVSKYWINISYLWNEYLTAELLDLVHCIK